MRALSLFSGAGGMDLGLEAAGIRTVALCEIMTHARVVLRHRFPGVPLHDDVTTLDGTQFRGLVDLVHGGSPCQDLSVAGKRAGLTGSRSSLFHHQVRIWEESEAPMILWENVPGAFSSNGGRDFATVLSSLVGAAIPVPADGWRSGGVAAGRTAVAAFRTLDAQFFGVPQRRSRVFVLGVRAGGPDPAEILALAESLRRDTPQSREARQDASARAGAGVEVAGSLGGGSGVRGFCDDLDRSGAFPLVARMQGLGDYEMDTIASAIKSRDYKDATDHVIGGGVAHTLRAEGFDASEDGTGRGTPPVAQGFTNRGIAMGGIPMVAPTLVKDGDAHSGFRDEHGLVLAIRTAQTSANGHGVAEDVAHTLDQAQGQAVMAFDTTQVTSPANRSNPLAGDPCHPLAAGAHPPCVIKGAAIGRSPAAVPQRGEILEDGTCYTLNTVETHAVCEPELGDGRFGRATRTEGRTTEVYSAAIPRRLTPTECERLMSWPDGHTAIGITEKGNVVLLADGPRYRLCGNGVASVCAQWIGERIVQAWTALRREEAA
jgi:DNA (cytosine-5)-methyltransferase 1